MTTLVRPWVIRFCVLGAVVGAAAFARAENWPQWRGPHLNGSTTEMNLPTTWSTTENVAWAVDMPGPGAATPIIWGDHLFISSENPAAGDLLAMCFNSKTGKLVWRKSVGKTQDGKRSNTMASPSAVTDGQTVWFTFGTGTVVAYDFAGNERWRRELEEDYGEFMIQYGYSSSPLLYRGKLYFVVMQSTEPNAYKRARELTSSKPLESFLLALDPATGKTLWRQVRPSDATGESRESYTTPMPFEGGGKPQIILVGAEFVTAHDADTGTEAWRWEFSPHDRPLHNWSGASAVTDGERLFIARPKRGGFYGLKGGATGLADDSILLWQFDKFSPYVPTPLLYQGRLYILQDNNKLVSCVEPETGELIWRERLNCKSNMHASPVAGDGKVYVIDERGEAVVFEAGDTYRELHRTQMGGRCAWGSIAISGGHLYIRTADKLYCIGK